MSGRLLVLVASFLLGSILGAGRVDAQEKPPPPVLRLEAGGPTSMITALAFSPDGQTLYAAGLDKVVRLWGRHPKTDEFELDDKRFFRVPVNPGTQGVINAMALSPDGQWLAVGGLGVVRETAGFFVNAGRMWPTLSLTPEQKSDLGLIHVFSTDMKQVKLLRGHQGPIRALSFAPNRQGKPPMLVSLAQLWDGDTTSAEAFVWDVAAGGAPVAKAGDLPAPKNAGVAPALVALHTGDKLKQLRVVLALGDEHQEANGKRSGFLRVWDLDGKYEKLWDGYPNTAIVLAADEKTLLGGTFADRQGSLQKWDMTASPPQLRNRTALAATPGHFHFPIALGLLGAAGQDAMHAALVVRRLGPNQNEADFLRVVDMANAGQTRAEIHLWDQNAQHPTMALLAASSAHVAVAGGPSPIVRIHAVADLLQNRAKHQLLKSAGASMQYVAFARDAKDRPGLLMSETAGAGAVPADAIVFDFEKRLLSGNVQGWSVARPAAGGWSLQQAGTTLRVVNNNKPVSTIQFDSEPKLTALLPPMAPLNAPLVAVAFYEIGKALPTLDIYHGETGKHFRRCTAHTGPLTSLAFSPDGKFIVSAAHDQTVAVWSLTDVGEVLDRHGRLPGVAVEAGGQVVKVVVADKGSPLVAGTIIQGAVIDNVLKPFAKARDFYEAFWLTPPGQKVTLRVLQGKQTKDIALAADQGIDERKPLFFMFITAASGNAGGRDWLGWHAQGPFDASSKSAERHLGWHINTGQAEEPTKFAFIDQYRKEFFKPGLLQKLIDKGALKLDPPPPAPKPEFGAILGAKDPMGAFLIEKAANGDWLVRQPQAALHVQIKNLADQQTEVVWRLNDGEARPLESSQDVFTVPLDLPAKAARHKVRVSVHWQGADKKPEKIEQEVVVRHQPPPPVVQYAKNSLYEEIDERAYSFRALVGALGAGPGLQAELFVNDRNKPEKAWVLDRHAKPTEVVHELVLDQGENLLKLVAQNQEALAGFEEHERLTLTVKVRVKLKGPAIAIQAIEQLEAEAAPLMFKPGQQIVVGVPRVRIAGALKTQAKLEKLQWEREGAPDKTPREAVAQLKPGKNGETYFSQEFTLKPGPQTVRFFAKDDQGQEGNDKIDLLYRPELPQLVLQAPEAALRHTLDDQPAHMAVAGKLLPPAVPSLDDYALQALVTVNGVKQEPIHLKSTDLALPAHKAALKAGANRVHVSLTHAWGGQAQEAEFTALVVRPPVIGTVTHTFPDKKLPFVDLRAEVASPGLLLTNKLKVLVNGQERSFAAVEAKRANDGWVVHVHEVALVLHKDQEVHKNEITLAIANEEAISEPSVPLAVVFTEPPPPPPVILVDAPSPSQVLSEPDLSMIFRVRSVKQLKRVQVTLESDPARPVLFQAQDLDKRKAKDADLYEFSTSPLKLQWGMNTLKVTAVNNGGETYQFLDVSAPIWPVKVSITALTVQQKKYLLAEGTTAFPSVPGERAILEGKVRWSSRDDELFKKPHQVRVYVNGFQQAPALLTLPGGLIPVGVGDSVGDSVRERVFRAPITLTMPENKIELDLPSLKLGAENRLECEVACANPRDRGQHLHVVLVSPGLKKGADLKKTMISTLKAEEAGPNLHKNKVFDRVYFYVVTGYVLPNDVQSRLFEIQCDLRERAGQGAANDVVMFYFLGQDGMTDEGWSLLTSGTAQKAFALSRLKSTLSDFTGAQALFLDLRSGNVPSMDKDRFAMFRYYQPGPASPPKLLQELEQVMPKATWLDQLPSILEARVLGEQRFVYHHPPGLKIRLNP